MPTSHASTELRFEDLQPGDRITAEHLVTVGRQQWTTSVTGRVVRTERRRHGLHFRRHIDDKVFSDIILLELPDSELTTVAMDEFTILRGAD